MPEPLPVAGPDELRAFFGGAVLVTPGPVEVVPTGDGPLPPPAEPSPETAAIWAALKRQ